MRLIAAALVKVILARDTELLGLANGFHALVLGLYFMAPWWDSSAFPLLKVWGPYLTEPGLGALLVILGLSIFFTVGTGQHRALTSSISTGVWWGLAVASYLGSAGNGTVWPLLFSIGLSSAVVYLRATLLK